MAGNRGLFVALGLGLGIVAVAAMSGSSGAADAPAGALPPAEPGARRRRPGGAPRGPAPAGWRRRIFDAVSASEGSFTSINPNDAGSGVSMGVIQWNQGAGSLGQLLEAMHERDDARLHRHLGSTSPDHTHALIQRLNDSSREVRLGPMPDGNRLSEEPWISRLRAIGADPLFQEVQINQATGGAHWQGAERAARALGAWTERGLALTYDTSVQQGPGFAQRAAERIAAENLPSVEDRLRAYAAYVAGVNRRLQASEPSSSSSRFTWREVAPGDWHRFAGRFDLYTLIRDRRGRILSSSSLTDDALPA